MNITIFMGRLTKTPELKSSASGVKVLNFTLAANKKVKDVETAIYINCVAFNKTAEIIASYTEKGSRVIVQGELQSRSYEKDGQKVYTTEIVVNQVSLLDSKKQDDQPVPPSSPRSDRLNQHKETIDKRLEEARIVDTDDLPF